MQEVILSMDLFITPEYVTLSDFDNQLGVHFRTSEFLGDLVSAMENEYPDCTPEAVACRIKSHFKASLGGTASARSAIYGLPSDHGSALLDFNTFIGSKNSFALDTIETLQEIERMRISNHITRTYLIDLDGNFHYPSISTLSQAIIAILHYYAFTRQKIARCAHCGKWFSTDNLKEKYCSRRSPFPGYSDYTCKTAVKAIKDGLEKRRKSEYERLRQKSDKYGQLSNHQKTFNNYCSTCQDYQQKLRKGASVELLLEYKSFLYDSAGTRPKYDRIKDW